MSSHAPGRTPRSRSLTRLTTQRQSRCRACRGRTSGRPCAPAAAAAAHTRPTGGGASPRSAHIGHTRPAPPTPLVLANLTTPSRQAGRQAGPPAATSVSAAAAAASTTKHCCCCCGGGSPPMCRRPPGAPRARQSLWSAPRAAPPRGCASRGCAPGSWTAPREGRRREGGGSRAVEGAAAKASYIALETLLP